MSLQVEKTLNFSVVFQASALITEFATVTSDVELTLTGNLSDEFSYTDTDLFVTNVEVLLDGESVAFEIQNGDIIFFTEDKEFVKGKTIEVRFTGSKELDFTSSVLTDETYDKNLKFNVNVRSDNNSLIRDVHVANQFYENVLNLESSEQGVLGNVFNDLALEDTKLGRPATFIHTNKLYGSGYDLEMYYKDNARVKWTLETIGVAYKMRRTRSR